MAKGSEEGSEGEGMKWKPGESGNPSGRPKRSYLVSRVIEEALLEKDGSALVAIVEKARGGDLMAIKVILERVEGAPATQSDKTHAEKWESMAI